MPDLDDRDARGPPASNRALWVVLAVLGGLAVSGLAGCVLVAGLGLFQARKAMDANNDRGAAEGAAHAFLGHLQAGRPHPAYALTSAGFRAAHTREQFDRLLADHPILTRWAERSVGGPTDVTGDPPARRAVVRVRLHARKAGAAPPPPSAPADATWAVRLVHTGGAWQVDDLAPER